MDSDSLNIQTVPVKVVPALKEYICAVNEGSDIIFPNRESRLWGLVKTHLDLVPPDYKPTPIIGHQDTIRIAIYPSHRKNWNHEARRVIVVDTLWRNTLTPSGEKAIADYLMRYFKQTFRSYMTGALGNNEELSIREVILKFCELYKVDMDIVTYEMLRKDWFRFRKRNPKNYIIPIENQDF